MIAKKLVAGFIEHPQNQTIVNDPNGTVTFPCSYDVGMGPYIYLWCLNGSSSADYANVIIHQTGLVSVLFINGFNGIYNETKIECKVHLRTDPSTLRDTAAAFLILQGTLPGVEILNGTWHAENNTFFITWKPPFMLPITQPSVVTYSISIYYPNGTLLKFTSGLTEPYYSVHVRLESVDFLNVIVVATNEAGEGSPKTKRFELPFLEPQTTGGTSTTASDHDTTASLPNTPIKELIISVPLLAVAAVAVAVTTVAVCVFKKCPKDKLKSRGRSQRSLRRNSTCSQEAHQEYDIDQDAANVTVVTELETSIQGQCDEEIKIKDDPETEAIQKSLTKVTQ